MKFNILHLSDFHFSRQRVDECRRIGAHLAESTAGIPVDAVIFTGDMVQDVSDGFDLAYEALIEPVRLQHQLPLDRVLVVPGNHDKVRHDGPNLLVEELMRCKTEEQVNAYYSDNWLKQSCMVDFERFNRFHRSMFGMGDYGGFGRVSVFNMGKVKVGLVGLNSAWCCTYSSKDRGNLLFPLNAAEEIFEKTKDCDLVLTAMHHNLADFKYFIARKFEDIIQRNTNVLLTGHYHKQALNASLTPKGCMLHNVAPATFDKYDELSSYGYCIITIDTATHKVESSIFHYDGAEFRLVERLKTYAMMSERKRKLYVLRKIMQRHLGMLEVMVDSLILTNAQQRKGLSFEQLYARPMIVETGSHKFTRSSFGKTVSLQDIEKDDRNALIITRRKKEQTSLLFKLWLDFLRAYDVTGTIPFYIDCTRCQERKDFFSIEQQLQQFLGQTSSEMSSTFQEKRLLLLLDDLDMDNEAFLNSLEHSMKYLPSARFIACMCEDKAEKAETLRLHDKQIPQFYLKGFRKRLT
jgi:hypothetical protein